MLAVQNAKFVEDVEDSIPEDIDEIPEKVRQEIIKRFPEDCHFYLKTDEEFKTAIRNDYKFLRYYSLKEFLIW